MVFSKARLVFRNIFGKPSSSSESPDEEKEIIQKKEEVKNSSHFNRSNLMSNVVASIGEIQLQEVEGLNARDIEIAKETLQRGDIVLVGTL